MKSAVLTGRILSVGALFVLVGAVGCGPRGESNSLEQVYSDARASYRSADSAGVPSDVSESLKTLAADLERLAGNQGGGDAKEVSRGVANTLDNLVGRSGMTQRPSMTELVNQYRALAKDGSTPVSIGAPNVKLLVARTYTLLKSELSSTKFGL
jgi:hypothetical protein